MSDDKRISETVTQSEEWELTIHLFPEAAKAGLAPIDATRFTHREWEEFPEDKKAALYSSHRFVFINPPSRKDLEEILMITPWAQPLRMELMPLLFEERNQWPMMDYGHKGSHSELFDEAGLRVGKLDVWRKVVYKNKPYQTTMVDVGTVEAIIRYVKKDRRKEAQECVDKYENRIRERLAVRHRENPSYNVQEHLGIEIQRVLKENGFRK